MTFIKRILSKIAQTVKKLFPKGNKKFGLPPNESEIENEYKRAVKESDRNMKEEIRLSHIDYETEYASLEKRFESKDGLKSPDFFVLEKALDEKYLRIATSIGEKYADIKQKLDVDVFNSIAKAHYQSKQLKK